VAKPKTGEPKAGPNKTGPKKRGRPAASPVTLTQLPTVNCALCGDPLPHQPGRANEVLTEHYNRKHLAEVTLAGALSH
jgi:hypothetical protein